MSEIETSVGKHYGRAGIAQRILDAVAQTGGDVAHLKAEMLYPVDQFHGRGIVATREHAAKLRLDAQSHVLDIGCGVGGPARFMASTYGCRVTGIDLTEEFVAAARELVKRCGLADKITLHHGNALTMPFADRSFDAATSFNVTMNIAAKDKLAQEIHRVLKPGGKLIWTEDSLGPNGAPHFPLPWAREPSISFLVTPEALRATIEGAGLRLLEWSNETEKALEFVRALQAGPPPSALARLGNTIVMGDDFAERARNSNRSLGEGRLAGTCVLAQRPA